MTKMRRRFLPLRSWAWWPRRRKDALKDAFDVRDGIIDCVVMADGLLPGLVGQVLMYVAVGEYELAVDSLFEYSEVRPGAELLGRMEALARRLGVRTSQYLSYWARSDTSERVYGQDYPAAVRNAALPSSWTQEDVDACVEVMLEDGLTDFLKRQLTGRAGQAYARNGTGVLYWVTATMPREYVSVIADLGRGVVVSGNRVLIDQSATGRRARNLMLQVARNRGLPHEDFAVVLQLLGNGEWATALTVLCTQLHECGATVSPHELEALHAVDHLLGTSTNPLLRDNPPGLLPHEHNQHQDKHEQQ